MRKHTGVEAVPADLVALSSRIGLRPSEWTDIASAGVSDLAIDLPTAEEWREAPLSTVEDDRDGLDK